MTREEKKKAIDALKISAPIMAVTQEEFNDYIQTLNKIMNWLEQEPKTVLYSGDGYADGYMVYDMAECPNCGYEYEESDKDWELPFCPNCGQSLIWESEEQDADND